MKGNKLLPFWSQQNSVAVHSNYLQHDDQYALPRHRLLGGTGKLCITENARSVLLRYLGELYCCNQRIPLLIWKLCWLKQRKKKNRVGTWINLQAEAPLSHGCPLGATTEEHDRPWRVDKTNLKIPFPGWFYLKVSFLLGVFPVFPRMLKVVGTIPSSCSLSQHCSWLWTSKQFLKKSLGYERHAKQTVF